MTRPQILAPTPLEYLAVRCLLPAADVRWAGMRLVRWRGAETGAGVLVCGLAGALAPDLAPGTVLIPERVGLPDGRMFRCDPALVEAMADGARRLGYAPDMRPLLTAPSLVTGQSRREWAGRDFAAVDMEAALLATRSFRTATIRVILDTPGRDISSDWQRPGQALLRPDLWREVLWLALSAPRYSLRAARVLKAGLSMLPESMLT
jgi:hypothetical protein